MSDCRQVRTLLTTAKNSRPESALASTGLREHLDGCPDCARYAERLTIARSILSAPASEHVPGPEFAAKVLAHLPKPTEILGRTALRLLPITGALVLVLSGWALATTPAPTDLFEQASTDDLAEWVSWSADDFVSSSPSATTDDSP